MGFPGQAQPGHVAIEGLVHVLGHFAEHDSDRDCASQEQHGLGDRLIAASHAGIEQAIEHARERRLVVIEQRFPGRARPREVAREPVGALLGARFADMQPMVVALERSDGDPLRSSAWVVAEASRHARARPPDEGRNLGILARLAGPPGVSRLRCGGRRAATAWGPKWSAARRESRRGRR